MDVRIEDRYSICIDSITAFVSHSLLILNEYSAFSSSSVDIEVSEDETLYIASELEACNNRSIFTVADLSLETERSRYVYCTKLIWCS